jgi:hypothetical protein
MCQGQCSDEKESLESLTAQGIVEGVDVLKGRLAHFNTIKPECLDNTDTMEVQNLLMTLLTVYRTVDELT